MKKSTETFGKVVKPYQRKALANKKVYVFMSTSPMNSSWVKIVKHYVKITKMYLHFTRPPGPQLWPT